MRYKGNVKMNTKPQNTFSLTIGKMEYGWADIEFIFDGQPLTVICEYTPNDALADFVKSAIQIFYGVNSAVVFPNGSKAELLTAQKTDEFICRVSIGEYSEELTVKQYIRAVLKMFDKYTYVHSEEEYTKKWQCPFPSSDLKRLRECFKAL